VTVGHAAGPPFGVLDDNLPSDAQSFWARHRMAIADEAAAVAGIRARPEFGPDSDGQTLLDQLQEDDQPLAALIASHQ